MAAPRKVREQQLKATTPAPAAERQLASPVRRASIALAFSLATGLFLAVHPASLTFWDPGRGSYWRTLYVPGDRPHEFAKIAELIPPTARVASTDFVHPRYTHFARSYDYSDYARKVAGYEDKVPDDTDFIVIDTRHPYSKVHSLEDVRELRTQPDQWEVIPNETNGAFLVLKRRLAKPAVSGAPG